MATIQPKLVEVSDYDIDIKREIKNTQTAVASAASRTVLRQKTHQAGHSGAARIIAEDKDQTSADDSESHESSWQRLPPVAVADTSEFATVISKKRRRMLTAKLRLERNRIDDNISENNEQGHAGQAGMSMGQAGTSENAIDNRTEKGLLRQLGK